MVRGVDSETFWSALREALQPRIAEIATWLATAETASGDFMAETEEGRAEGGGRAGGAGRDEGWVCLLNARSWHGQAAPLGWVSYLATSSCVPVLTALPVVTSISIHHVGRHCASRPFSPPSPTYRREMSWS